MSSQITESRRSPLRRMLALVLTVVTMVAGGLAVSAPAYAAAGGVVSGTVTAEDELNAGSYLPIAGVEVTFFPLHGSGDAAAVAVTDGAGQYSVSSLETGTYRVRFSGENIVANEPHRSVWYGGFALEAASSVLDLGPAAVPNVDAQLALGGSITGTISFADATPGQAAAAAFLWNPTIGEFERFGWRAFTDPDGDYSLDGLPPGDYLLKFGDVYDETLISTLYWDAEDYIWDSTPVTIVNQETVPGKNVTLERNGIFVFREAGPDRFSTGVEISQHFPPNTPTAFIVNGMNFPDALSAGPAADLYAAPVLLVAPTFIPDVVKAELQRLNPEVIVIVGGPPAVSTGVENELYAYANQGILRVAGSDRYATSRAVAEQFWGGEDNRTSYLATGANFPDALGAGPAAANENGPLVLVNGPASAVDAATDELLEFLDIDKLVIAGGPSVVSASLEQSLTALPYIDEVYRRDGVNRYQTAVKVSKYSFTVADTVFLATGANFPDALAGAALAGYWDAPIYLVQQNCVPIEVLDEITRLKPREIHLLGGLPALGAGVENFIPCPA